MWVFIDNYDSFTYLIRDYFLQLGKVCRVFRHDEVSLDQIEALDPERIILSPGPKRPEDAGICMDLIDRFHTRIPLLGVCLGHQAIGVYFGAELIRGRRPMHGKIEPVIHQNHPVFDAVPSPFLATRYHSLILSSLPDELTAIAKTENGEIMAIAHKEFPCLGFQFHPESIGTPQGFRILQNWVNLPYPSLKA